MAALGGRARRKRAGPRPPLPSSLPAGGGARARRPAAPPPPPLQAVAARWRRRRPGGRGRSARLAASLLPREAEGTLSRAAAPRPVDGLRLGHGGPEQRRACERSKSERCERGPENFVLKFEEGEKKKVECLPSAENRSDRASLRKA